MPEPAPDNLPPDAMRGPSRNRPPGHNLPPGVSGGPSAHATPETATTSPDQAEPGMWLTASTWLPAALLDGPAEPGRTPIEVTLSQGGPLDVMPPGPVLAAFLAEASAPAIPVPPTAPASAGHAGTPDSLAARIVSGAGLP